MELLPEFIKITTSLLLGSLLGIQRTFAGKTAGMRTYGLVAMGSTLFIISSEVVSSQIHTLIAVDPTRVAAGIITGIGFLGAGVIFFQDNKLNGLTTAAGLWVSCGIGIAIGFGLYELAIFTALLTLFSFTVLWKVESWLSFHYNYSNGQSRKG